MYDEHIILQEKRKMLKSVLEIAVLIILVFSAAAPAMADQTDSSKQVPTAVAKEKVDKPAQTQVVAPKQEEPVQNYDDFTDENKNGIDDQFERAERKKVKVQEATEITKPTEPEQKKEVTKAVTPDK